VKLTGLGAVTHTLPGSGGTRDQARYAQNGSVATVVGRAIVVTVVVRTVVPGAVRDSAAEGRGFRNAIRLGKSDSQGRTADVPLFR
jgi:hypothetical protein